jgi:Ni/Fe-hydrogenase subunit HybB-like protein
MTAQAADRRPGIDPRAAARMLAHDVGAMPRALKAWLGFLLLLCALGAVGALLALPPGWEVFGTSPSYEWGILITAYVFFAITTSGLCLASSLGTVFGIEMFLPLEKRHAVLALLTLVTAFGLIALDLHYPVSMVFGAILSPSPLSPMWWMGVFYGTYLVFLMVEVWSIFSSHWGIHRWACVCSSVTAIVAPTTLGAVFAVLGARPYWHGAFTPPAMMTMAVVSGTALLGIVFYLVHRYRLAGYERALTLAIPAIRLLMTIGLVVSALVVAWQILWGMYGIIPGLADANRAIFAGPLAFWFWVVRIGMGLAIPLLLLLAPKTRTPAGLFVTCCLVFVGIFADRAIFVGAGQIVPGTAVGGVVSDPFTEYAPTVVEIAIVLGAFGFFGLVYTLAERYLPMGEHTGHLAGGFLSGSHPAPGMVDAGVAWLGGDEDIEYTEHAVPAGAEAPAAEHAAAVTPVAQPAAVEVPAGEPGAPSPAAGPPAVVDAPAAADAVVAGNSPEGSL